MPNTGLAKKEALGVLNTRVLFFGLLIQVLFGFVLIRSMHAM